MNLIIIKESNDYKYLQNKAEISLKRENYNSTFLTFEFDLS